MGVLAALESRLAGGETPGDDNGYFIRTKEGKKLGPMEEYQFNALRSSEDVAKIASAWRMAGGNFYKVQLSRKVICDARHACSFKACNHFFELFIIILCFGCTCGVFMMLFRSDDPKVQRELRESGPRTKWVLGFLFLITILVAIMTVRTLLERWRKASTDVFVSEV